jgi:putative transposase
MKKTSFTEVQIIGILNEKEQAMKVSDLCRKHGISEATFYNWKSKYGGMKVDELKRLRELEQDKDVELTTSFLIIDILSGEPIPGRLLLSRACFRFGSIIAKFKSANYIYNLSKFSATFSLANATLHVFFT